MQKLSDANEPDEEDPFANECDEDESEENEAFIEDDEGEIGEEDDSEEEEDYIVRHLTMTINVCCCMP